MSDRKAAHRMRRTRFVPSALLLLILTIMGVSLPPSQAQVSAPASPQVKLLLGWGPDSNTPGVQLTLEEERRDTGGRGGATRVFYHLVMSGFPKDKTYKLSSWRFGHAISIEKPEITTDEAGNWFVDGTRVILDWSIVGFARGEPFRVGLISTDETVKAFAKTFPFPIEARDGSCHLWMELATTDGKSFAVYGDGFDADDHATTTSTSGTEIIRGETVISSGGTLPPTIILPAVVGKQSGTASFSVASKSCVPIVNYEWGPPAMKIQ